MTRSGDVPVAVGLGSNRGDRSENLRFGVRELERRLRSVRQSSVWETAPREGVAGGPFLNMCVAGVAEVPGETSPGELMRELLHVELGAGRPLERPPGRARTLDLDLLLVGDRAERTGSLTLPHPRMHERAFVLRPLAELTPDWRHPTAGRTVREMAEAAGEQGLRRLASRPAGGRR